MTPPFMLAYHVILLSVLQSSALISNHDTVKGEEIPSSQHFGHGEHHSGPNGVGITNEDRSLSSTNDITTVDDKQATIESRNNNGSSSGKNINADDSLLHGGKPREASSPFHPYTSPQSKSIINEIPIMVITSHVPPIPVMTENHNIVHDKEGFTTSDLGFIKPEHNNANRKKTILHSSRMDESFGFTSSLKKISSPALHNSQTILMTSGNIKSLQDKINNNVLIDELQRLNIKKEEERASKFQNQNVINKVQTAIRTYYVISDTGEVRKVEPAKKEVNTGISDYQEIKGNALQISQDDFGTLKDKNIFIQGKEIIFSVDLNKDLTMIGEAESGSINPKFDNSVKNPNVGRINELKDTRKKNSMLISNNRATNKRKLTNKLDIKSVPVQVKLSEDATPKTNMIPIDSTDGFQTKIVSYPENLNSPKTVIIIEKIQSIPNQSEERNVLSRNDGFLAKDTPAHKPATSSHEIVNARDSTTGLVDYIISQDVTSFGDQNILRAGSQISPAAPNTLHTSRSSPRNTENEREGRGGNGDTRLGLQSTDFRTRTFPNKAFGGPEFGIEHRPGIRSRDLLSDRMSGGGFLRPSLFASSSFGSLGTRTMTGFPRSTTFSSGGAFRSRRTFSPTAGFSRMFPVISPSRLAFPGTIDSASLPTDFVTSDIGLPVTFPFSSGIAMISPETFFVPPATTIGYPAFLPGRITPEFARFSFPFLP